MGFFLKSNEEKCQEFRKKVNNEYPQYDDYNIVSCNHYINKKNDVTYDFILGKKQSEINSKIWTKKTKKYNEMCKDSGTSIEHDFDRGTLDKYEK